MASRRCKFIDMHPGTSTIRRTTFIALFSLALAFAFLGTRGIWDPDEGRYTNVALTMLDTGDWLNPHRSQEVTHWTKPPLTYWAVATSLAAFGHNPWAARLPSALSFLACVFLVWRITRRLFPGNEDQAALIFATMLLPAAASQLVTTDFILAACETLAMWSFVEARFGAGTHPRRWTALMWAALALAFLTKGPPALLPLLVVVVFGFVARQPSRSRVFDVAGVAVFVVLALPWFVDVTLTNPGLIDYLVGNEVVNRITTNEFGRHGEWYGWAEVYVPTLMLGTLPWTLPLFRFLRSVPERVRMRTETPASTLVVLWIALPLVIFCIAKSRLPLYLLPLFVPLAIALADQRAREARRFPDWRWIGAWGVLLLAVKLAGALWPSHNDAHAWAEAIQARSPGRISQVLFVEDNPRYGLHLYLGADIEILSLAEPPQPARFDSEYDESIADELGDDFDPSAVWVVKVARWPAAQAAISRNGFLATPLGSPYEGRVFFKVRRPAMQHRQVSAGDE